MESRPASMRFPKNFHPVSSEKKRFESQLSPSLSSQRCEEERRLTSRNLEDLKTLSLSDEIDSSRSRHRPRESLDSSLLEVRDRLSPISDDRDGITRSDERSSSVDHVPVTISIRSSSERDLLLLDSSDEVVGVGQVGIGVGSSKVGKRNAVLDGGLSETEGVDEDGSTVRTSDSVESVEEDGGSFVAGGRRSVKVGLDEVEVEDGVEEGHVVGDRVDDLDVDGSDLGGTDLEEVDLMQMKGEGGEERGREGGGEGEGTSSRARERTGEERTHLRKSDGLVLGDGLGNLIDLLGDVLRSRSSTSPKQSENEKVSSNPIQPSFSSLSSFPPLQLELTRSRSCT